MIAAITAKSWAYDFYQRYYADRDIQRICDRREQVESKWTHATFKVLTKMARSYGCKVTGEDPTAGGGRADQRWVKDRTSSVFVEHENRPEYLTSEISKLCNDVSKLKALLTYVADMGFRSKVNNVKRLVKKAIDDHKGSFIGEFLLMVSGYNDNDWHAYRYRLRSGRCEIRALDLPKD